MTATAPRAEVGSGFRITSINKRSPVPDFRVGNLVLLEGTCSDATMQVWLIELAEGVYWAKKKATITAGDNGSCTWNAEFHPDLRSGTHVEVIAVGNPRVELLEMKELFGWPPAQATSQIVTLALNE